MKNRMNLQALIALLCTLMLLPFQAFGWSKEAHQAIALIAMKKLTAPAADRIKIILGTYTLEDIAVCPDEVRDLEEYHQPMDATCKAIFPDPPTGTANWHFVDTPIKNASYTATAADVASVCTSPCAATQIKHFLAVLAASKPTDTGDALIADKQALSYVVHFIGDIHQPLHSANRNDKGGNDEHVKFFNTDQSGKLVLHHIWDDNIVYKIQKTPAALASSLSAEIAAVPKSSTDPVAWALEAYIPARDIAYEYKTVPAGFPTPNGDTDVADLGQDYQDMAAPVVQQQVARAGVRLAAALNTALGSGAASKGNKTTHKTKKNS